MLFWKNYTLLYFDKPFISLWIIIHIIIKWIICLFYLVFYIWMNEIGQIDHYTNICIYINHDSSNPFT